MILDTTFIIDFMRGEKTAVEKMQSLLKSGTSVALTAPSITELFSGLEQSSKPMKELEKIKKVLNQQVHWPLDYDSAELAGRIHGKLAKEGKTIDAIDAMITGIALQHKEPVLTKNSKHFSRIAGLKVESY